MRTSTSTTRRITPTLNSRIASVGVIARKEGTQSPERDGDQLERHGRRHGSVEMNERVLHQVVNLENKLYGDDHTWKNDKCGPQASTMCHEENPQTCSEVHAVERGSSEVKGRVPWNFNPKGQLRAKRGQWKRQRDGVPKETENHFTEIMTVTDKMFTHNVIIHSQRFHYGSETATQQHIIKRLGRAYWRRLTTHHGIRRFRRKTIKLHNRLTGLTEHNDEIQVWESTTADDLFSAIFWSTSYGSRRRGDGTLCLSIPRSS